MARIILLLMSSEQLKMPRVFKPLCQLFSKNSVSLSRSATWRLGECTAATKFFWSGPGEWLHCTARLSLSGAVTDTDWLLTGIV